MRQKLRPAWLDTGIIARGQRVVVRPIEADLAETVSSCADFAAASNGACGHSSMLFMGGVSDSQYGAGAEAELPL